MSDYVTLIGAETVQSAASSMHRAADKMQGAANARAATAERQERFMRQFLDDFEVLLRRAQDREL